MLRLFGNNEIFVKFDEDDGGSLNYYLVILVSFGMSNCNFLPWDIFSEV